MVDYEYKLVAGLIIFYYTLLIILGYLNIPTAYALDYENVNVLTGVYAMFDQPFQNSGVVTTLFAVFMVLPIASIISMVALNYLTGR